MTTNYLDTYYSRTLEQSRVRPTLSHAEHVDVCIVGAGLAGLTAGLSLARAGKSVVILESRKVGWGASGRNGGFVSPGFSAGQDVIRRLAGPDDARTLHMMSIEGVDIVRQTLKALSPNPAPPTAGITRVVRYNAASGLLAEAERSLSDYGYRLDYLDRNAVQGMLYSERYYQGLRDPQAFQFHPLNYAVAVAAEIERLGGRIYEASEAVSTDFDSPLKSVRTNNGSVLAKDILFTTGGYTTALVPALKRSHLAIATYVMLTQPAPDLIARAIKTTDAIGDDRRAGDYYRLVDEGRRILWGGRITTRTAVPRDLAAQLRQTMVSTYPQLKPLEIDTAWSGLMSYARHRMPQIGRLQPNIWYCTAFGGHGMNTTAVGGKVIAEGIIGSSDRYRLFEPFGLVWNGGPAGKVAAQMVYWKLQAGDWVRERDASRHWR